MADINAPLVVYDIGARGKLQDPWHEFAINNDPAYRFILLEPDPAAAAELREVYKEKEFVSVVESAAYHRAGEFELNIARHATCSSLLRPNFSVLQKYNISPIFETVRTAAVKCDRLDNIIQSAGLPHPDYIKIDVQGVEFQVLLGLGNLLNSCIVLEMETHMYQIYQEQRVLADLIELLGGFDLFLCQLTPQRHFEYDLVEANALFCRHENPEMNISAKNKLSILRKACGIEFHPQGTWIKDSLKTPRQ